MAEKERTSNRRAPPANETVVDKYDFKGAWGVNVATLLDPQTDLERVYCPLWEMVYAVLNRKVPAFADSAVWQDPDSAGMLALVLANLMLVLRGMMWGRTWGEAGTRRTHVP